MQRRIVACVVGAAAVLSASVGVRGQEQTPDIRWQAGPSAGSLGDIAQITVPEGFRFTGQAGTRTFLELTQNPTNGSELGILLPESAEAGRWFVVFDFNSIGYVKDDEKDKLDADDMILEHPGRHRGGQRRAQTPRLGHHEHRRLAHAAVL